MRDSVRKSAREALIAAAFEVLSRDPSAPLSQVAERAGVGRATLHRYFSNREDLIRALAAIGIAEMESAVEAACEDADSYGQALQRMFEALIPLGDRHGFLALEPLDNDPQFKEEFERQRRETVGMVEAAKREGLFDKDAPTPWIIQAYEHLLYAAWESVRAGNATSGQAAALAWRTLTRGLGKNGE